MQGKRPAAPDLVARRFTAAAPNLLLDPATGEQLWRGPHGAEYLIAGPHTTLLATATGRVEWPISPTSVDLIGVTATGESQWRITITLDGVSEHLDSLRHAATSQHLLHSIDGVDGATKITNDLVVTAPALIATSLDTGDITWVNESHTLLAVGPQWAITQQHKPGEATTLAMFTL